MRVAILKRKADAAKIDLGDDVALLIAKNLRSNNVRELEGALDKVLAFARFHGKEVNMVTARACSQSSQPDEGTREMNERQKGLGEFVVASGDATEMLDTSKEALDQVASAVKMAIELARCQTIGTGRYDSLGASCLDSGHEMVEIKATVVESAQLNW